ncbi:SDR family NAD(P)-dependent oxidoreductase [Dongia sedimenti]|uniref:SDR family NAD(P)-dependent oxidoreductase n=1 Tax=Dongia sedimenti TaxID=3064282 RepID=A0ABU0YQG1_9PROT|nr:SDR family NAD(P)-dependent oxidoreductase [Rhodospirillaceae bacterium R-7]
MTERPAKRMDGRVAVVTGGAQGIGFGIARRFAEEGAHVVIADIKEAVAKGAAAKINAAGGTACGAMVDIGDDASVAVLAAKIEQKHGRCEILVNNAAISDGTGIETLTMQRYHQVTRVNQDGAIRMSLAFVPLLKKGGEGRRILNIASILGVRGWPDAIPYATAKGAIVNFTRALACDLAPHGIMVNALAPGFVDTPMSIQPDGSHEYDSDWFRDIYVKYGRIPLRRYGNPDDMAGPAFFLCSDDARYVTGQVLMVDGGASATF